MKLFAPASRLSPAARTVLLWLAALAGILSAIAALPGCSAPAPTHITLPSTVPVRKALAVVEDSHRQVQGLVEKAAAKGLTAGSADARALVQASVDEGLQITALHTQVFDLTAQLIAAQPRVDALAKHDAAETVRADAAVKERDAALTSRGHWRLAFIVLFVVGTALVSILGVQLQKALQETEEAAAHAALAVGRSALHAVETIPAVVGTVAKTSAIAAIL